jgi:hypothetical protein
MGIKFLPKQKPEKGKNIKKQIYKTDKRFV